MLSVHEGKKPFVCEMFDQSLVENGISFSTKPLILKANYLLM